MLDIELWVMNTFVLFVVKWEYVENEDIVNWIYAVNLLHETYYNCQLR